MDESRARKTDANDDGRWLETALPQPAPDVVIGIGWAIGRALDVLESIAPACRVVLIEPTRDLAEQLSTRRAVQSGRVAVLTGPDFTGVPTIARAVSGLAQAPVIVNPRFAEHHAADTVRAREVAATLAFQGHANDDARRALAPRYLLHSLLNVPAIARESDAGRLTGAFAGVPAIIAAAGPSLDRNVHEIFPFLNRGVVIACDTAAGPLSLHGVTPHITVAVDASEANARHLSSLPANRSFLVAEGSVHPSALGPFANRTFFFKVSHHEPWPWLASLGLDRARLDAWGSVATTAFALALEMGCDPIVFAGTDFAFTGGRPYCRGVSTESQWATWVAGGASWESIWTLMIDRWPKVTAIDVNGEETRTARHLVAFRDWIVERAANRADRRIVNVTGAGLLHGPAIVQATAADVLETRPVLDAGDVMRQLRARHQTSPDALAAVLPAATSIVVGGEDGLTDRWRKFTYDALSREVLRAALASPEQRAWALGASAHLNLTRTAS